jgi:hypothetical protein
MFYRILCWLGWRRPPEKPAPARKSSALLRLQGFSARSSVDQTRRPHRGGTGTWADHLTKEKPAVKPDDNPPS